MHLAILLFTMMVAVFAGKHSKKFGVREYLIVVVIALIQTALTVRKMLTMEMPPLF